MDKLIVNAGDEQSIELPSSGEKGEVDLPPGQIFTIDLNVPELNGQTWIDFKAGNKTLLVWGTADFTDAFGKERWLKFRLMQRGGYVLNLMHCDEGNETSESQANPA